MKVFSRRAELNAQLQQQSGSLGLVPTMGALHEGHISLVNRARQECDRVAVTIFVNPTQFNDPKDLKSYPRTPEADLALLEKAGVDIVYMPTVEDVYPEPDTRQFEFGRLDKVMEGLHRPGHFNGVGQVVSRLFEIVMPDRAYFGEKDFQQLAIIRKLVVSEGLNVEIVGCPILRGDDGLALSSRNALLTPEHRKAAPLICQALKEAAITAHSQSIEIVKQNVVRTIDNSGLLKVEYFSIVNADTLEDIASWSEATVCRACIAVQAGAVRLIDNIDI